MRNSVLMFFESVSISLTTIERIALWSFWVPSTLSILRAKAVWLARIWRSLTNARMIAMFIWTARLLLSTDESMATPCSVAGV